MTGQPIEIGDADSFEVRLNYAPRQDAMGPHRHRAKKALDMKDDEVPAEDLEALKWVREKKGTIELGKPYTISKFSDALQTAYKESVPARPVTVEVPVFWPGAHDSAVGCGSSLRSAVSATEKAIALKGPLVRTYPEYDTGLDRVLLVVGKAELRVSDLCALIRDYYEERPTGGSLHCSLDDGNMEGDVRWEVDHARDRDGVEDHAARLIGELLMLMTSDERKKLYERGYGR